MRLGLVLLGVLLSWSSSFSKDVDWRTLKVEGDSPLEYGVWEPPGFDPSEEAPLLLAFPPGDQGRAMATEGFNRYWGASLAEKGWVVVSPVAPEGKRFGSESDLGIGHLIRRLRIDYKIKGHRIDLAGASAGGRSAFSLAIERPHDFRSLLVLPGMAPEDADLNRLRGLSLHFFVGGDDTAWLTPMKAYATTLDELGIPVELSVFDGEGHTPLSVEGETIPETLQDIDDTLGRKPGALGDVSFLLDEFHDAATKGDEESYFDLLNEDAVFLGSDGKERWTKDEFRKWAMPHFQRESAWVYVPQKRHVFIDSAETTAWFDEEVVSHSYGVCRGSGVLQKSSGGWKISQYNLTIPVPNELAGRLLGWVRNGNEPAITTKIYVVRHAEKDTASKSRDPNLIEVGRERAEALVHALKDEEIAAVFTSPFNRTRETITPLAASKGLTPIEKDPRRSAQLVETIRDEFEGKTVVVCGHSNTVPELIKALGIKREIVLEEATDYDSLFLVRIAGERAELSWLHYGAPHAD